MTTETKTLRIRRATALDAVNVYRLLVDEEKRTGRPDEPSAAEQCERLSRILDVIRLGYAAVAVYSGRLVGSIGAIPDERTLMGSWFALHPSFQTSPVGPKMFEGFLKFARKQGMNVRFATTPGAPLSGIIKQVGLLLVGEVYESAAQDEQEQGAAA